MGPGRCGGENRFDAAKHGDGSGLTGSCSLCGDDHHCFVLFEIGESGRGHAVHNLLEIGLAGGTACGGSLRMLGADIRACGL